MESNRPDRIKRKNPSDTGGSSANKFKRGSQFIPKGEWLRALTLKQWRLAEPVKDPTRNISHAGESLDKILEELGATGGLEEKQLQEAWLKVAGDFIAKNAKPESLKKGTLVLRVVQPTLKFQLEQMKGKLLQNFRRELGEGVVKVIILRIWWKLSGYLIGRAR